MNRRPGFSRVSDEPGAVHLLDATQRPPESAQGQDLFALLLAQDVGHPGAGSSPVAAVNVPARSAPLAGFQVSINGRFWVSPEVDTRSHSAYRARSAASIPTDQSLERHRVSVTPQ